MNSHRSTTARLEDNHEPKTSWNDFFSQEVTESWGDAVLIVGCFVTGLTDSAVFNVWSCFVSMQTGNTVYVGLGVSGQPLSQPYRWCLSGTAILSFILGSFLFSRLMRFLDPLRRRTVMISIALQAVLCFVSAILSTTGIVPPKASTLVPHNCIVLLPLVLLAMQSGGQCVLSRFLGYNELPTVVLTSGYCDLAMDPNVFGGLTENSKRNRRLASIFMVITGAILGGFLTTGGNIELALWIVGGIKMGMAGVWLFWRAKSVHLD